MESKIKLEFDQLGRYLNEENFICNTYGRKCIEEYCYLNPVSKNKQILICAYCKRGDKFSCRNASKIHSQYDRITFLNQP